LAANRRAPVTLHSVTTEKIEMTALVALAFLATSQAIAQTAPNEFPPDAVPVSAATLQESLAGKIYSVRLTNGTTWRLQFDSNGYYFINTSDRFNDHGKWRADESKLCTEPRKAAAACNEIRQQGAVLYLKRDSGEVVGMSRSEQ
jgi:hypothetical protein